MSEDIDHGFYIDAVVQALKAAGLTVVEYEAFADEDRSAYMTLASPNIVTALGGGAELHLTWSDGDGWNVLYRSDPREVWGSIDTFRTLDFLDIVAPPSHITAALQQLLAIHSDSDMRTADEMLADYLPATPEPEPDPADPRQIAIDLIHQNIREGALRHVRIAVSEQYDLKALGREGYAAKCEEVREHIIRATVTVEIPDEVIS